MEKSSRICQTAGHDHSRARFCWPQKAILSLCVGLASGTAFATEGGGSSYTVGLETNRAGMMQPEGLTTFVYYSHYSARHSKDDAGNDNNRFAYFKFNADAVAGRATYVWPGLRWLGANVETRVAVVGLSSDLTLGVARPAPLPALDRSGQRTALADVAVAPVILGWHGEQVHQTVGIETYLPIGSYDVNRPVNTGRNYYQAAPAYAVTWLPPNGADVGAKFRYAFNSRNEDTNYRSGNEFTVEYSAGYRFTPQFSAGINGFLFRQTTDDVQNGASVNGNGNRGIANAIGPYVSMVVAPKFVVTAKLQREFGVRNRGEGTRFWLQTRLPF